MKTLNLPNIFEKRTAAGIIIPNSFDLFSVNVSVAIKTKIMDKVSGKCVKESPWRKNLVLDQGLNALARLGTNTLQCGPASMFQNCLIGDGTTPTKIASGAITFTQAGTTLTASGAFFASTMVGAIFKWGAAGSGGNEVYITAFTDSTHVTVGTSATVGTPDNGVVWQVQQANLTNFLFQSTTYQTNAGDNLSTISGAQVTHQRTFTFPVQGSNYNVNEIGYSPISNGSHFCLGRIVLPSTDVVTTTNFYLVIIQITVTYSPGAPAAVGNIGVNFNTAGNAMVEWLSIATVLSNGQTTAGSSSNGMLDAASVWSGAGFSDGRANLVARIGSTYTQNGATGSSFSWGTQNTNFLLFATPVAWANVAGTVGKMRATFNQSLSTTGQTCHGIGISGSNSSFTGQTNLPVFDIKLTTPQALPNGTWLPTASFDITYGRTLVN
jgi:hypothetical protein